MNGYLMAGGRATRFGSDKRQALLDGVPIAAHAADRMRRAVGPNGGTFAVGPPARRLSSLGLPWLEDEAPDGMDAGEGLGPCAGLLAVVRRGGGLVLAADMPLVPVPALQALSRLGGARPAAPIVGGRLMPLCAWWPADAAAALEASLRDGGGRATEAFRAAGGVGLSLEALALHAADAWRFTSVNTPLDLRRLALAMRERRGS